MKLNDIYKKIQAYDEALNEAASASINMSGDNAEDVIKLMNALKGEKGSDTIDSMPKAIDKPIAPMPVMGPPDMGDDMAKLRDIVDGPKDRDQLKPGIQGEPCKICGKDHLGNSGCGEGIEEVVVGGNAKPEDPNSVYARLMGDLSEIQNGAMDDNDMADDIADELGDYLRNGDAPKGSHYEKAIGIVMDAIHDGPQAQAEAAEEAISVLHSSEEESRGNNEEYANEPDEKYQDQHYMTKDLSGGSEQGQKRSYAPTNGGDNPMALEDEIRNELRAQLEAHMGEGGDHEDDDEGEECPQCGKPGKTKLMACGSCGCS